MIPPSERNPGFIQIFLPCPEPKKLFSLRHQELFPTTTLEPGGWIMKPDTIPVDLHKVKYEKMKRLIIEAT
jgi:hypothetical protein